MNLKKRVSRNPAALVAEFTLPLWNRKIARAGPRITTEEEKFKAFAALHPIDVQVHVFKTASARR